MEGSLGRAVPDEVAADRAAQLEAVTRPQLVDEEGRDLPVLQSLDGQDEAFPVGRGCQRVAPLGLVAVLGRQADVDVLAGAMAGPAGDVEDQARDARCLRDELDELRQQPA